MLCASLASQVTAQDITNSSEASYTPPAYQVLRLRERYGYLADPALRQDAFDHRIYIQLGNDTNYFLTLGGEVRERFEGMHNPDFGLRGSYDAYWLQRIDLFTDLHLGEKVRLFAEGILLTYATSSGTSPLRVLQRVLAAIVKFATVDPLSSVRIRGSQHNLP